MVRRRMVAVGAFLCGAALLASTPGIAQATPTEGQMSKAYLDVVCPANAKQRVWDATIDGAVVGTASVEQGRRAAASWAAYNPKFARQLRKLAATMRPDVAEAVKSVAREVAGETPYLREIALIPQRQVSFARYVVRYDQFIAAQPDSGNAVRMLLGLPLNGWCPSS